MHFPPLYSLFLPDGAGSPAGAHSRGVPHRPPGGCSRLGEGRTDEQRRGPRQTAVWGEKKVGGSRKAPRRGVQRGGSAWPAPGRAEHPRPRLPPPLFPKPGQGPTPGGVGRGGRPRLDVRRRVYKGGGRRGDPQRRSRAAAEPPALPRRLLPAPAPPARCCRAASTAPWPCSPSPWPSAPSRPPPRTLGSGSSCRNPWLPPPGSR